jgi:CheY-like chemotaxis protein
VLHGTVARRQARDVVDLMGHLLIVEDDEIIRESLVEFLADHGYDARSAIHGREALDQLQSDPEQPCLVVLDLMMPVMDGTELREEMLRDPKLASIPVIVISAYRDLTERVKHMGPVDVLPKPLKLPELLTLVEQHCSKVANC